MIKLNGQEKPFQGTLELLLTEHQYQLSRVAVLVNGEIIKREFWSTYILNHGDAIDVVTFVGGG